MVRAYHVIFGAYGFWLPNDPRGSWSDYVRRWELFRYGPATKAQSRRSVAGAAHDRELRFKSKSSLRYSPVSFTGVQARCVGLAFGVFAKRNGVSILACAILPEHVHLVVARHRYRVEQIVNLLKGVATKRLIVDRLHPLETHRRAENGVVPSCWSRNVWKVFLNSDRDIARAIRYVEINPLKENKPRQKWSFVQPSNADSPRPVGDR